LPEAFGALDTYRVCQTASVHELLLTLTSIWAHLLDSISKIEENEPMAARKSSRVNRKYRTKWRPIGMNETFGQPSNCGSWHKYPVALS
jgi:hypothetical protein